MDIQPYIVIATDSAPQNCSLCHRAITTTELLIGGKYCGQISAVNLSMCNECLELLRDTISDVLESK